jgi:hypothetical protein
LQTGRCEPAILTPAAAQSGRRVYYGTVANLITSVEEAQAAVGFRRASKS